MDNDEVSPPSPLLFANPGARCHVSDVARSLSDFDTTQQDNNRRTATTMPCNGKVSTRTATRAHHHPPRRWPITTPSIGDEDPGPAPPHECQQRPSTTPRTMTTAHTTPTSMTMAHYQHHPTNGEHGPAPPHEPAPTNDDNGHYQHLPTPYERGTRPTTTPYQRRTWPTMTPYQRRTRPTTSLKRTLQTFLMDGLDKYM